MTAATIERWKQRAAEADANRASFPLATQMLEELRAEGFENARVTFAELPDGRSVGQRSHGVPAVVDERKLKFFLYDKQDLIARKKAGIRA